MGYFSELSLSMREEGADDYLKNQLLERREDLEYVKSCLGDRYSKHTDEFFGVDGDYLDIPEIIGDIGNPF